MKKEFTEDDLNYYYSEWHVEGELEKFLHDHSGKSMKITIEVEDVPTKTYNLPYGIVVNTYPDGSGEISSDLESELEDRDAVDIIESMILSQACAGICISDNKYIEALVTSVETIGQTLD